ncbi:MAG: 2-succinyl-5-enolpyruvyl-6-hydroxy-3-cyclohexene-1-carboxylic-acid synthase [Ilumatobacteraceae bacterium]
MVGDTSPLPQDVQATFCATLVDEWIRLGIVHAVIAPGSRSTPLALALTDRAELRTHVVHDERVAGFVALGLGLGGVPALLLCTSGTAAANFFPAVVEAGLSEIPMLVVTADRPEELRGVGAPQTIDQIDLYGRHVRWSRDAGVADHAECSLWRDLARDASRNAATGPVQLNLPFREPLMGTASALPEPAPRPTASARTSRSTAPVPAVVRAERGVILAGGRSGVAADDVTALHRATGWPILADPMSAMRHLEGSVAYADGLLRHPGFAADHRPDVIVRLGRPASSKVLAQWAVATRAALIQVGGPGVIDPDHNVTAVCSIVDVLAATSGGSGATGWTEAWSAADLLADATIESALAGDVGLTEPAVARAVAAALPHGAVLTVASSMPVRDLEWFGGRSAVAYANRGANGIDGVVSTALGRALDGVSSVVLLGDLAFVHDSNALLHVMARNADLRVVVVDNDGGGIFSFLPQASALEHDRFEQLFGTPLGVDVLALAAAHGIPTATVTTAADLASLLARPGPWVARVPSDRQHNVAVHDRLHAAVAAALDTRTRAAG